MYITITCLFSLYFVLLLGSLCQIFHNAASAAAATSTTASAIGWLATLLFCSTSSRTTGWAELAGLTVRLLVCLLVALASCGMQENMFSATGCWLTACRLLHVACWLLIAALTARITSCCCSYYCIFFFFLFLFTRCIMNLSLLLVMCLLIVVVGISFHFLFVGGFHYLQALTWTQVCLLFCLFVWLFLNTSFMAPFVLEIATIIWAGVIASAYFFLLTVNYSCFWDIKE